MRAGPRGSSGVPGFGAATLSSSLPVIKYQGTPLDILLVQQDGWNGSDKVGWVCSLSHQHLPFFCPVFPLLLLYRSVCVRKKNLMDFLPEKRAFQHGEENMFVSSTWCSCSPLSISPPPPPPAQMLFDLRSDGLAFSSRASLLSCSAALVCDWLGVVRAAAHFSGPA